MAHFVGRSGHLVRVTMRPRQVTCVLSKPGNGDQDRTTEVLLSHGYVLRLNHIYKTLSPSTAWTGQLRHWYSGW
jgi:hypothetical protein